jgi:hypothetical protein
MIEMAGNHGRCIELYLPRGLMHDRSRGVRVGVGERQEGMSCKCEWCSSISGFRVHPKDVGTSEMLSGGSRSVFMYPGISVDRGAVGGSISSFRTS